MAELTSSGQQRRELLKRGGALALSFSIAGQAFAQASAEVGAGGAGAAALPGSLKSSPMLDAWVRIDSTGMAQVFSGKAELGQGIRTALLQIAADELELPLARIDLITADTQRTANEGFTAGSHSVQDSGTAIRNACAQVRALLIDQAAHRLETDAGQLYADSGEVVTPEGKRLPYGDLVSGLDLHVQAQPTSQLKAPAQFKSISKPMPRVDIPAKLTGGAAFLQDMRLPGMLHARIVRPPGYDASLLSIDESAVSKLPGVVRVVRDGDFLAVVARKEYQAIAAMRSLQARSRWSSSRTLPDMNKVPATVLALARRDTTILDRHDSAPGVGVTLDATYTRPYQMHGSIGPSCAIARVDDGVTTVWSHTQGVFPLRGAISGMLQVPPERVHVIHVPGSGCYGHNGADDVAGDAALIANAMPGQCIRVQLMREQEHTWEPYGGAMVMRVRAVLDEAARIVDWHHEVFSNTHMMRPGPAGSLLAAQHCARHFPPPAPIALPQPEGGGDRNAIPLYRLPSAEVVHHFLPEMPIRVSSLRGLGAFANVFAIESMMAELALSARRDPVEFRLAHLDDSRARDVVSLAAQRYGWNARDQSRRGRGHGHGFAFARYKNLAAYCAIAMEVEVDLVSGKVRIGRVVAAVDTGQIVNPDGVRNQIEGGIVQSSSWTLFENVAFDDHEITSSDWSSYPIMRFDAVPRSVDVHLIDRPGLPFLGSGEAAQGPTGAALANAIAEATGHRFRDLPLRSQRIREVTNDA